MTEKIRAIVIDIRRHTDRHNVVTVYSREHGRIAFLSPSGSGKQAKMRQARLQPLAVIEADVRLKSATELQNLGTFSLGEVWHDIYFHPVKQMMALFLTEFLNKLLKATMPDPDLWDYIVNSLRLFDSTQTGIADFHIAFLAALPAFTGIQPDASEYEEGMWFDMRTGHFTDSRPAHPDYLIPSQAAMAATLCRVNYGNIKALHLNGHSRLQILNGLLRYFSIHFPGTGNLRSPEIIHDIFHS